MPYTNSERRERETFREFDKGLKSWEGTVILVCPACRKVVREYKTRINGLNSYAFKDGVQVDIDGRGCCF